MNQKNCQNQIEFLSAQKNKWRSLSEYEKIHYIDECMQNLMKIKEQWVKLSAEHKKIHLNSKIAGQEWISGPSVVMRALRLIKNSLGAVCNHDAFPISKITKNKEGQYVARVVPVNFYESILFYKINADIIIKKNCPPTQGQNYSAYRNQHGSLCVVLGAGNVSSMPALDVIDKLFAHGSVCLLKFNPVNDYLYEIFEVVFKSLIKDGFFALAKGDKSVGEYLCAHPLTDEIHITGSYQSYQEILKHNKKVTAELGCVTPAIIVPGQWTKRELEFQVKQIASAVENNASFNCNAIKVLIISKHWKQKDEFLNSLRKEFKLIPPRYAYYPGAHERYHKFLEHYPNYEILSQSDSKSSFENQNVIPWTLIPDVPVNDSEYALNHEAFCGVLAVIEVDDTPQLNRVAQSETVHFLSQAVSICNNFIRGNLSCSLIADPRTYKKFKDEIETEISNLKYGSIGFNCWSALSYALCATPWGAFPTESTVQSGIGFINNGYFFDYPEKSVIRAPFHSFMKPVWFHDNKNLINIGKNLVSFEYSQSFFDFIKLALSALKS